MHVCSVTGLYFRTEIFLFGKLFFMRFIATANSSTVLDTGVLRYSSFAGRLRFGSSYIPTPWRNFALWRYYVIGR